MISSFALPVLMIVVFYFLLIRPQQKREKDRQKQLKALEKGDRVLTRGGIFGTVVGVKGEENIAIVKISDDVKVEVAISTLDNVVTKAGNN
jgi:preprotein translocase subunit YajC